MTCTNLHLSTQPQIKMPDGQGSADRHIQGVLGALLGDFAAQIAGIDHTLVHAVHLMTGYDGIFPARGRCKPVKQHTAVDLLQGTHREPLPLKIFNGLHGIGKITPCDRILRSKERVGLQ